jgi:hypothetical protein
VVFDGLIPHRNVVFDRLIPHKSVFFCSFIPHKNVKIVAKSFIISNFALYQKNVADEEEYLQGIEGLERKSKT